MEKAGHPLASMAARVAVGRTIVSFACGNDQVAHTITRAVVVLEDEASLETFEALGMASKPNRPLRPESERAQAERELSGWTIRALRAARPAPRRWRAVAAVREHVLHERQRPFVPPRDRGRIRSR